MELYQVNDEGHWFSQNQINRFHEKLKEVSGNENIAREAGKYAASPDALGVMRQYLLGLIGPKNLYELVGKYASKLTRSSLWEANVISPNKVEMLVIPAEGVKEEPFQCSNRIGYFEAATELFGYKLPKIEHPDCLFNGADKCRYIVSWEETTSALWRRYRNILIPIFLFINLTSLFIFSAHTTLVSIFPISLLIISLVSLYANDQDRKELKSAVNNLIKSSDDLIEQININYKNSLLINEIGQALSKESDLDGILAKVVNVLEDRLDYDRGLILLANPQKTRLISRAGYGYGLDELSKFMMSTGFHLDRKESKGIFVACFNQQKPFLVNDIEEILDDLSGRSLEFAKNMGVKSFICCPIIYEGESLGVLAVDNIQTKKSLVQSDINMLMGIAPQIAVSIHNVKLVEARMKQFQSILQALVASTEARDPITAGHSERVTDYAVGISNELGLPTDYTDMIRVAASLHDYGKIGVDDAILKKNGRLSEIEYEHIKTHAGQTRHILERVNFEGIYKQVPNIAASHHEKLDGSGYPSGLSGDEIPFGAKVIAVADVFEALTSKRHYRDPMPVNEALDHLVANIGNHFEEQCVEAFINYYNANMAQIPYLPKGRFAPHKNNVNYA
jgi:HD-GYP domain-containing protein (c-di-GMP phosphodiesterase class II)